MTATVLNQKLTESNLFFDSVAGLKQSLGRVAVEYGSPPVPVALVPSSFAKREISMQMGGSFTYPIMAITMQRLNIDRESYNSNLRRIGIPVVAGEKILVYRLIPVLATFRVRFITQDNAELLKFSTRWLQRQKDIQFKLANQSLDINIKVRLSEDLNIPEQDMADWGSEFQLETECDMRSYIGEVETKTRINTIALATNLWDRANSIPVPGSSRTILIKPSKE